MNKTELLNKASRAIHKVGFKFKKHSPEILLVVGAVSTVAGTVMACKATTKLDGILEEAKEKINKIHEVSENPDLLPEGAEYTVEDSKKDLTIVYAKTGLEVVKLYAPAASVMLVGLTAFLSSHKIMRTRNFALATAYATLDKSFKEYRGRVVDRFGKDLDNELRYNIKAEEIEETVTNEDGTETTVKKTVQTIDPNTIDDSSRIWYEGNPGWCENPEFRLMYLKRQQSYATEKLQKQGVLFLNEVYEMLGFKKTSFGAQAGWIYNEENPIGDNYVDFGLYDLSDPATIRFTNGDERGVVLKFNHDGYIIDKM